MKRVEVVMTSSALHTFKDSAAHLGIAEYDVSDVRLSPNLAVKERRRLYRGQEYTLDLLSRVKVEFAIQDEYARPAAQSILTLVAPDTIAIFPLDEVISMTATASSSVPRSRTERGAPEVASIIHH
jgi:nitrogen regulatory protein PII